MADDPAWDGAERRNGRHRPPASLATIVAAITIISVLISGGVSTIMYLNSLRNGLDVLQNQVMRDETELRQARDDERDFRAEMRKALEIISGQIAIIRENVAGSMDGRRK